MPEGAHIVQIRRRRGTPSTSANRCPRRLEETSFPVMPAMVLLGISPPPVPASSREQAPGPRGSPQAAAASVWRRGDFAEVPSAETRKYGELRGKLLASALRAFGLLRTIDQRFELVLAFLAGVLIDGHS